MTDETNPPTSATPELPQAGPSRMVRFGRTSLRWATALLVVFALGVVASWVAQIRPQREALRSLDSQRTALASQVADLEAQVSQLDTVRAENAALKVSLAKMEIQQELYRAQKAVSAAQVAMAASGDVSTAHTELAAADRSLSVLEGKVAGSQVTAVRQARDRLTLADSGLGSDPFAAQKDLEVLANGLIKLESVLSGG